MSAQNIDGGVFISSLQGRSIQNIDQLISTVRRRLEEARGKKRKEKAEIAYLSEKLLLLTDIRAINEIWRFLNWIFLIRFKEYN